MVSVYLFQVVLHAAVIGLSVATKVTRAVSCSVFHFWRDCCSILMVCHKS